MSPRPSLINAVVDLDSFNIHIQNNNNLKTSLKTPEEVECGVNHLTNILQQAIWNSTTPYRKCTRQDQLDFGMGVQKQDRQRSHRDRKMSSEFQPRGWLQPLQNLDTSYFFTPEHETGETHEMTGRDRFFLLQVPQRSALQIYTCTQV